MRVELVYVTTQTQYIQVLDVAENETIESVIKQSTLLDQYPEINLDQNQVGIFGEVVSLKTKVKLNDRIEIYRPLSMDPMEARRLRARAKI